MEQVLIWVAALFGPVLAGVLCALVDRRLRAPLSITLLLAGGIAVLLAIGSSVFGALFMGYLAYAGPVAFVAYFLNR